MTRFLNNFKTVILLGGLFGLAIFVGSFWGNNGMIIAFAVALAMNGLTYFFSDWLALTSMSARQVDERTAPDLVNMVRKLSQRAGLPMPRVYVCPQDAPNAFATGRSPSHAAVAVTQGALRLLTYEELEGVMAHELAHVKNRDTLTSCIAATLAGVLMFATRLFYFHGGDRRDGLGAIVALLMVIFAPLAALLIQLAISRSREYVADADGATIAGTPHGLISALRKLDSASRHVPLQNPVPTQNHMFIVQPLTGAGLASLFSSHPPTESRVKHLLEAA